LYGFKTWFVTLREEQRLRLEISRNEMLWRIFVPARNELKGEWRNALEDLYDFEFFVSYFIIIK
jgi:hypothetical protein